MKNLTLSLFAAFLALAALAAPAARAGDGWETSLQAAIAASKATGKPILADFTGSDWCGWCIKLHKEVFVTAEFKKWAADSVVLLEVDFPQGKRLPKDIVAQNEALKTKFGIQGFPTILVIDPKGNVLAKSGYKPGGPAAWIASVNKPVGEYLAKNKPAAGAAKKGVIKGEWLEGKSDRRDSVSSLEGAAAPALSVDHWVNTEKPVDLADLKGKIVVLVFWAAWDDKHFKDLPRMNVLADRYAKDNVVVLGVCASQDSKNMAEVAKSQGLKFPVAVDTEEKTFKAYNVDNLVDHYVIDGNGVLRAADVLATSLEDVVKALVAEAKADAKQVKKAGA